MSCYLRLIRKHIWLKRYLLSSIAHLPVCFLVFFSFFLLRASGLGIIEVDNYQKKKAIYSRSTQMMFYQCKFFLYFQQNSRAWFLFGILALTHFNPRLFKYAPGNEQGILKELKFPNDSVKFSNDFHSNRKRRLFLLLYQTQLHSISKCNFF